MASTIEDVAREAGVGVGTVSRVLNNEKAVSAKTRQKVKEAMDRLGFAPNRMAVRLRKNETRNIALLVPVINHPFFAKFAEYVDDEADKFGYSVLLVSSQRRVQKEADILERIRRREVDGAVFVTHFSHDKSIFEGCPVVSIDRKFGEGVPYITSDNYDASVRAIEYLIEKGCSRIGFIGSKPLVDSEVMERERAYKDVMRRHGMPERIENEIIRHGDENEVVAKFLEEFKDVDGIFASGYTMAQVLYETLLSTGRKVPDEIQIISYDGAFSQWNNNRVLTCVEQPIEEMAREVVRTLIKKIHGEETELRTVLKTELVIGATTK